MNIERNNQFGAGGILSEAENKIKIINKSAERFLITMDN